MNFSSHLNFIFSFFCFFKIVKQTETWQCVTFDLKVNPKERFILRKAVVFMHSTNSTFKEEQKNASDLQPTPSSGLKHKRRFAPRNPVGRIARANCRIAKIPPDFVDLKRDG